eukprot:CAMPEP_0184389646 /NCGR_PEP_ID=MMETSP0007-20130409/12664_1 /TAXON_ID=97485 /ORGANISM="Prymnesium parvum, Strain Texoma1" /LENGTH=112 /DNA_ID=CAMNT_0026739069 /DNA_START=471 /DNA_END=806 /DNA_ORIENTATION=-
MPSHGGDLHRKLITGEAAPVRIQFWLDVEWKSFRGLLPAAADLGMTTSSGTWLLDCWQRKGAGQLKMRHRGDEHRAGLWQAAPSSTPPRWRILSCPAPFLCQHSSNQVPDDV